MKIRHSILTLAVGVALASASTAQADRWGQDATSKTFGVNHSTSQTQKASWKIFQDSTGKITIRLGKRIIYVYYPASSQPPIIVPDTSSGQDCLYWGFDCDPTPVATDTQPASDGSAATDSSITSEGAPADNAGADAVAPSDSTATQSTGDTAVNLSDPSQNDDQDC
jgi:hypothetical protein